MDSGIYRIIHNTTNREYIGSAINISRRWYQHKTELRHSRHTNKRLQNSWNKYGENEFSFEVIELCDISLLIEREQFYIDTLKPYYNIVLIAGSQLGYKHTDETIKIIQEKRATQKIPVGLKRTDEQRKNISISHKGIKLSEETKRKISVSNMGRINEHSTSDWKVISPSGEVIFIRNLRKFCKENNLTQSNMVSVSKGIRKHHKGWKCEKVN